MLLSNYRRMRKHIWAAVIWQDIIQGEYLLQIVPVILCYTTVSMLQIEQDRQCSIT
jgi:hypothetical protein